MSSKDHVRKLLELNRGNYLSGEQIAADLHISRNAVWKAINALRKEGYGIEAVTNRGYRLAGEPDRLSADGIREHFPEQIPLTELRVFDTIESTNRLAKEMAIGGAAHGTVLLADTQTGGHAHHAKRFYSPPGGIYMSVILRPERYPHSDAEAVVACAAEAVIRTLREKTGMDPEIRGINDIYLNGRKVCGILTESVQDLEHGEVQWIVVGIGMNYCISDEQIPESLRGTIGSLFTENAPAVSRNEISAGIIEQLLVHLPRSSREELLEAYDADRKT